MKMSDILRGLADKLARIEQGSQGSDLEQDSIQRATPTEPELDDDPVMFPPLQQKHELLKKVAGVDNAYSQEADSEQDHPDELDRMKKMAGIVIAGDENEIN